MARYLQTAYWDFRNPHNIYPEYNSKPVWMTDMYFTAFIIFNFTKKLSKKLSCILYSFTPTGKIII